ncbi:MAG: hypothetical protein N3A01_03820 [Bacteroidales bacterium]|nr:hypothetical protein [Bacteroidales bacterium]
MIEIIPVTNSILLNKFINFPHFLYKNCKYYVPQLNVSQKRLLNIKKNPFFKHATAQYFLAYKDKKIVGRISAHVNYAHNEFSKVNDGFFGFFDVINDKEVAFKLFEASISFLRSKGVTRIIGPANFSTNETVGLLIEGFDSPPYVMMPYNYSYYVELIEDYGFQKYIDLWAYSIHLKDIPDKVFKITNEIEDRLKKNNINIRKINLKDFNSEVKKIHFIYNNAWDKNTGFIPMNEEEFFFAAKDLKLILDKDFAFIAEKNNEPIGFILVIPDINVILRNINNGKLFPFGILKFLLYKSKIKQYRIILMGVIEQYRKQGVELCFYVKVANEAKKKGIYVGEASWVLENNDMMNKALLNINAKKYKTYRLYWKFINNE